MTLKKHLIGILGTLCVLGAATAAPFEEQIEISQPDGTRITLWAHGDEFHAVHETLDGYTVTLNPETGFYHYASLSPDGVELLPTGPQVGATTPSELKLPKHIRIIQEARDRQILEGREQWENNMQPWREKLREFHDNPPMPAPAAQSESETSLQIQSQTIAPTSIIALTILVDFSDAPATVPTATIDNLLNSPTANSVRKYYSDNSNGLVTYTNVLTPYVRVARSKADYALIGNASHNLKIDAINALKALPNYQTEILPTFSSLTKLANNHIFCNVFYSGGTGPMGAQMGFAAEQDLGGNLVASAFTVQPIGNGTNMNTFAHESGHLVFDFPDLYDYNSTYKGAGVFCLMSWGVNLNPPAQICAYLKNKAGWATITDITAESYFTATVGAQGSSLFNHFYRYRRPGSDTEYFIIENRQKQGQDAALYGQGVFIWHIDEYGNNSRPNLLPNSLHNNYEASLVQADNLFHLQTPGGNFGDANDPYHDGNTAAAYTGIFDDFSSPSANWWDGTPSGIHLRDFSVNGTEMTFQVGNPEPYVIGTHATLLHDGYAPANNFIDPGETVTVRFHVRNAGFSPSTGVVVTLLEQGGVDSPSGPQSLGVLEAQADAHVDFTFTANAALGENLSAVIQIQEDSRIYGTFANSFTIGETGNTFWTENFDSVSAPNLPAGWTTSASVGTAAPWKTSTAANDTPPNSAFVAEGGGNNSTVALISPVIAINHSSTQLRFRHSFNTERDEVGINGGGVLEIKIGSGSWQDIVTAGGSWVTHGYNVQTLDASYGNPLGYRSAWGGDSGGFITTLANLPPGVAGQNVQFRWLYGYDRWAPWGGSVGWYVDTVSWIGPIEVEPSLDASPRSHDFGSTAIGQTKSISFTATNTGTQPISGTISIPEPFSIAGANTFNLGAGQSTAVTVNFTPQAAGVYTENLWFDSPDTVTTSPILTGSSTTSGGNNPPAAHPQDVATLKATPVEITLTGSDPDGDVLAFIIVEEPAVGGLTGSGANRLYTPPSGFVGNDSFTFKVNDGTVDSAPATVSITVSSSGGVTPWSPAVLDSLAWYDAADATTITSSGSAVSQWNDKSGHGYHATQTNSTLRPTLATGGILFGTNNRHLNIPKMSADAYSVMMVLKNNSTIDSSTAPQMPISIEALSNGPAFGASTGAFTNEVLCMFDEDTVGVFGDRQGASSIQLPSLPNAPHLYSFVLAGNWHIGIDGSADKRDLTNGSRNPFLVSRQVGAIGTNIRKRASDNIIEHSWTGLICEIVLLPTALSESDRHKMEGYLAHKWDAVNGDNALVTALPSGHPWKSSAPGLSTAEIYAAWAGPDGYNLIGGPNDDDDGDGLSNFHEFAFGLDPTNPDSVNPIVRGIDIATHSFSYTRNHASGMVYTVCTSTDLENWDGPADIDEHVSLPDANGVVTVEAALKSPPEDNNLFIRVKAE